MNDFPPLTATQPGDKCPSCPWTVPIDSKHAINALHMHRKMQHEGLAKEKRVKPQFLALCEATGGFDLALHFADRVIIWDRPPLDTLITWAIEAEVAEERGSPLVNQNQIDRMTRKLRRTEEWETRKTLDGYRRASNKLTEEVAESGTTAKPQLLQYAGMNVQYGTKEIAVAYPAPVTKGRRRSGGVKAIGAKPKPKQLPEGKPLEGEWRVIEGAQVADSNS